jgi:hypothetical protein
MATLEQEGIFRATVREVGIRRETSGAICVSVEFQVLEAWNWETRNWDDWRDCEDQLVSGSFYVIKTDGRIHPGAVNQLKVIGWNGEFASVTDGSWSPLDCQITVQQDTYTREDKTTVTRYRAEWLKPFDSEPRSGMGNVSADDAHSLDAQYGTQMRGLVGPKPRGGPPPKTRPPRKAASPAPTPDPELEAALQPSDASTTNLGHENLTEDQIPF